MNRSAGTGTGSGGRVTGLSAVVLSATVVAQVGIVVTGGTVRITDSGLGCPTWPRCTSESLTPTSTNLTAWIEFGNRLIALSVVSLCIASLVVVTRRKDAVLTRWAVAQLAVVVGQAVIGGLSVLADLHPVIVAVHLMISAFLIYAAVAIRVRATGRHRSPIKISRYSAATVTALPIVGLAVALTGALVTAAGPYGGDPLAARLILDETLVIRIHATSAIAFIVVLASTGRVLVRTNAEPGPRCPPHSPW